VLQSVEHPQVQLAILFLGGILVAGAMLWSLVPRREKLEPPGTPLDRDTHPLLFAELDDIADSLNEPLRGEVCRIGQSQRLRCGSRRHPWIRQPSNNGGRPGTSFRAQHL